MNTQPKPLYLADYFETSGRWGIKEQEAANCLRQMYEVNRELLEALINADKLITQLMPGVKHIALQDYGFLNTTLINNRTAIAKATGETK